MYFAQTCKERKTKICLKKSSPIEGDNSCVAAKSSGILLTWLSLTLISPFTTIPSLIGSVTEKTQTLRDFPNLAFQRCNENEKCCFRAQSRLVKDMPCKAASLNRKSITRLQGIIQFLPPSVGIIICSVDSMIGGTSACSFRKSLKRSKSYRFLQSNQNW